ncbi:unnamed protein product [Rangifer tarandus platyrhynchus]|uniref:Uncharacterized protein n=2 Tax=Rangifer tarandus platyrhynchus TaxID=3082113 RepID=A0ABN9A4H1_RANTA|nr:unnamed protein product [Rangifer tarandus platyrhynchus]CAI9714255.1 unnamed protein product [Rangifer tarandus platyrhynchus]
MLAAAESGARRRALRSRRRPPCPTPDGGAGERGSGGTGLGERPQQPFCSLGVQSFPRQLWRGGPRPARVPGPRSWCRAAPRVS